MKLNQILILIYVTNHIIGGECTNMINKFKLFNYKYQCESEDPIGEGSFGKVYKVKLSGSNALFALKVQKIPLGQEEVIKLGENEVQALKSINDHIRPGEYHIIKIFDADELQTNMSRYIFYVMEYLGNGAFSKITRRDPNGPEIPLPKIYEYVWHLLTGLVQMQKQNIVHLDIKPDNILMRYSTYTKPDDCGNGLGNVPVFADFGLVEKINSELSDLKGTLVYMAPEILRREPNLVHNGKMDVYSLGVTIYNLLYNDKLPFYGSSQRELLQSLNEKFYQIQGDTDFGLIFILSNMLSPYPEQRKDAETLLWYTEALLRLNEPLSYGVDDTYMFQSTRPITIEEFEDKYGFNENTPDEALADRLPQKSHCHSFPIADKPQKRSPFYQEREVMPGGKLNKFDLKGQNTVNNQNPIGQYGYNAQQNMQQPKFQNLMDSHQYANLRGKNNFRQGRNKILI